MQLHPQHATWQELRDAALLVDRLGYDSLWTWDHFVPLMGDADGPNYEGWQLLPAWGALTERVRIGMLVTGNTYRHPAVLAKMAATLDHITSGRAILGLGAAWHEDEHRMYGITFGTRGTRLARLAEAAPIVRSLLDQPFTTFAGKYYKLANATAEPKPIQKKLPLLIGGGGERKTLRIAARYADMWHGFGTPELIAHKIEVLRRHCADVGRDIGEILLTTGGSVIVRDDGEAIDLRVRDVMRRNRMTERWQPFAGTAEVVAQRMAAHWHNGVRGFLYGSPPPYDAESIERLQTEVRPRLEQLIA